MNEVVILLDTNVVSELMRPKPAQAVLDWFAAQDSTKLFFSAVSEAELRTGAATRGACRPVVHDPPVMSSAAGMEQKRSASGQAAA